MLSKDEANAIHECLFHGSGADVTQYQHFEHEIEEYLSNQGFNHSYLPEFQRFFNVSDKQLCSEHEMNISSCGCDSENEEVFSEYLLAPHKIVPEWAEAIRDRSIFKQFEEKKEDSNWVVSAKYGDTSIDFVCFFDRNNLQRYNFEPLSLEFGVSFIPSRETRENDWIFSWFEYLERGFQESFEDILQNYRSVISADFYEYTPIEDFRGKVEETLQEYLQRRGYRIRQEVGDACPAASRYSIDTGQSDFAAIKDESTMIVCHCQKSDGWHIHHLRDGTIESAESVDEIGHMIECISGKINTYRELQQEKQTVSNFAKTLTAAVAIITTVLLFDNINPIIQLLDINEITSEVANELATLLLLINTIVVVVLGAVIIRPYYKDIIKFSWEISQPEPESSQWINRLRNG